MKLNKTYYFSEIEAFADKENYSLKEVGYTFLIGGSFIMLVKDEEPCMSFVMNGHNTTYGSSFILAWKKS